MRFRTSKGFWKRLQELGLVSYWDNLFSSKSKILYRTDWTKAMLEKVVAHLQRQMDDTAVISLYNEHKSKLPKLHDDIVMYWFRWIRLNIAYKTDKQNYGVAEKWEDLYLLLRKDSGDCESQASLLYCLCKHSGISANRLRLNAGDLLIKDKGVGHMWMQYRRSSDGWFIIMDTTAYQNNILPDYRDWAYDDMRYGDRWFSFNDIKNWGRYNVTR